MRGLQMLVTIQKVKMVDVKLSEEDVEAIVAKFMKDHYWETLSHVNDEKEIQDAWKEVYYYIAGKHLDTR